VKIRTTTELVDELQREFAWRRKELTLILTDVKDARLTNVDYRIRCGIALLYAHWEGFIKRAAEYYLAFINAKKPKCDELKVGLLGLALRGPVHDLRATSKASVRGATAEIIRSKLTGQARIDVDKAIFTGSNLSSVEFREIVESLALDYNTYANSEKIIDEFLLKKRNSIAHGEKEFADSTAFIDLYGKIVKMLEDFKTQIENAGLLDAHRK
jgi:hypothetical protein